VRHGVGLPRPAFSAQGSQIHGLASQVRQMENELVKLPENAQGETPGAGEIGPIHLVHMHARLRRAVVRPPPPLEANRLVRRSFAVGTVPGDLLLHEREVGLRLPGAVPHELRALQEEDPHLQIEIPQEFDTPWPSRDACLSHAAALDEDTPGLVQPIPFSHKHHAGKFGIDCQYCHSGTDRSAAAGVPALQICMGCHSQFPASYDELSGIATLKEHWEKQEPIEWLQVNRLPEYVQFRHNRHLQAEPAVECQLCHGLVQEYDKVFVLKDTKWWPWGLPTQTLEMGWCIQCHREKKASQDCYTCHH